METSIITRALNKSKRPTLFTFMFFFLLTVQAQPWHSGSSYRRAITFNSADFTENVTDFLYYFTITDPNLSYTDNCSFVKNGSGYDFVFTDAAGTQLDHEIIEYDVAGTFRGWVEIPSISSSSTTTIYVFYGERGVISDPSAPNIYRPDIVAAWPFSTGNQNLDATSNNLDLTISGAIEDTGVLDSCITFDGTDDHLLIDDALLNFGDGSFSLEGWINVQPKLGASPVEFVQTEISSSQHAEEMLNSTDFDIDGHVLQLGRNISQYNDFSIVGIQFPSLPVTEGNEITDAYIEFVAQNDGNGFAKFNIGVEDTDDPELFSSTSPDRPSERSLTLAGTRIDWLPTTWVAGETHRTPNIASLIQPLVAPGWDAGVRTISVLIDGFGSREADNDGINLVLEYENPGGSTLYQIPVEDTNDDAEELDGTVTLTTPLTIRSTANDWVAVRFNGVAIPNNAVIDEVYVRFTANSDGTTVPANINISRQNSFNTNTFTGALNELSSLPKTTSINWSPGAWSANVSYDTPNLVSLFSNFFSDPQWSAGNAITFFFQPLSGGGRTAKSVDAGGTTEDPQLLIYYHILENEPQTIVSRRDGDGGFNVSIDQYGKLAFAADNDGIWDKDVDVKSLENVDDSQWHHFAAVKEEARLSLYLDGEPQDSRSETHQTMVRLIQDTGDDAVEDEVGVVVNNDATLDFGSDNADDRIVALRFQDVDLPSNATIVSSFIQVVSDGSGSSSCNVNIYGVVGNYPNVFAAGGTSQFSSLISGTPVPWEMQDFGATSGSHNSPDISAIVQNNISANWASGDSMVFIIQGIGTGPRAVRARDGAQGIGGSAALFIEYYTDNFGSISGAGTPTMYLGDDTGQLATSDENFMGSLDELRIYSSALSADDVRARYRTIADAANFSTIAALPEQVTWTGGGFDGNWNNSDNWNTGLASWDNMDFVYTNSGTPLDLQSTLNVGHISAGTGVSLDLNDQQLNVDCRCNVETFLAGPGGLGNVQILGSDSELSSPGSTATIPNLIVGPGNTLLLNADLVVSNSLSFADANGNLDANGQNITFSDPTVNAPAFTTDNTIYLGGSGSLTINGVEESETAIFHVSYDDSPINYARAELINNQLPTASYSLQLCNEVFLDGTCGGTAIEVNDVNKTWFITSASTDSDLRLYWHESSEGSEFERGSAEINHYDGATAWDLLGNDGHTIHIANTIYSSQANVTEFSPFSVSSHGATLPVELVYFEASQDEKIIEIEWQTATELNNDYFLLEKSTDGDDFEILDQIKGRGNSSELMKYKVIDRYPVAGLQYYRLTQVDFDRSIEMLGVKLVEYSAGELGIATFPNPVTNVLSISNLHPGNYFVEVLSLEGKSLQKQALFIDDHGHAGHIALQDLPTGVYTLNITTGNTVHSSKLVKR